MIGRGAVTGAVTATAGVIALATGPAASIGIVVAVADLVPSPSLRLARLGGTMRAGAEAAAAAAVVAVEVVAVAVAAAAAVATSSEAMEAEAVEGGAIVSCINYSHSSAQTDMPPLNIP